MWATTPGDAVLGIAVQGLTHANTLLTEYVPRLLVWGGFFVCSVDIFISTLCSEKVESLSLNKLGTL